jgi:GTP-binding protein Era
MSKKTAKETFRSGFVAIAGPPNAGKSTLLNRMLEEKISITSDKPQTTRNRILGVLTRPSAQIVFFDTPGVHRTKQALNVRIVDVALSSLIDADLVLAVLDAANPDPESENYLLGKLGDARTPTVLALNKIDAIKKPALLRVLGRLSNASDFIEIVPISAKNGTQVDKLISLMASNLPVGPPLFPPDMLTDMSIRFISSEMIREKVFRLTGQEIPYATAVTVEQFEENKSGLISIHAIIHVERTSQKGIVIGKNGAKLKQIGEAARKSIERLTGSRVFLKLFVRVQKNWSRDTKALRKFGY